METETQLRLIVDTTPALIYSARPDGYIDFVNQYCLEFLGLPLEKIFGWGWTKTVHPEDIEGVFCQVARGIKNRRAFLRRVSGASGRWRIPVDAASLRLAPKTNRGISSGGLVPVSILTIKKAPKRLCGRQQMSCGEASFIRRRPVPCAYRELVLHARWNARILVGGVV